MTPPTATSLDPRSSRQRLAQSHADGVALARRTGDLLNASVLPGPVAAVSPQPEAGFRPLFDGTAATF